MLGLDVMFSPDETLKGKPHWTVTKEIEDRIRSEDMELVTVLPSAAAAEDTHPPATGTSEYKGAE